MIIMNKIFPEKCQKKFLRRTQQFHISILCELTLSVQGPTLEFTKRIIKMNNGRRPVTDNIGIQIRLTLTFMMI